MTLHQSTGRVIGHLVLLFLTLLLLIMASIPNSVPLTGVIAPTDTADRYPVLDPLYGIDGLRSVASIAERDAIPTERRREGMLVYTRSDRKYWHLGYSLHNNNWVELFSLAFHNYYTKWEVDQIFLTLVSSTNPPDLTNYPNRAEVTQEIQVAIAAIPATDLSNYPQFQDVDSAIMAQLSQFLDANQTQNLIAVSIAAIPPIDLSNYPTRPEVSNEIQMAIANIPVTDLSNYLNQYQVYDAIQQAINSIPGVDLSNYPTRQEVTTEITQAVSVVMEDPRFKWGVQPNIIDEAVTVGDNRSLIHANTEIALYGDVVLGYSSELILL